LTAPAAVAIASESGAPPACARARASAGTARQDTGSQTKIGMSRVVRLR
jgi:hypothetical protein